MYEIAPSPELQADLLALVIDPYLAQHAKTRSSEVVTAMRSHRWLADWFIGIVEDMLHREVPWRPTLLGDALAEALATDSSRRRQAAADSGLAAWRERHTDTGKLRAGALADIRARIALAETYAETPIAGTPAEHYLYGAMAGDYSSALRLAGAQQFASPSVRSLLLKFAASQGDGASALSLAEAELRNGWRMSTARWAVEATDANQHQALQLLALVVGYDSDELQKLLSQAAPKSLAIGDFADCWEETEELFTTDLPEVAPDALLRAISLWRTLRSAPAVEFALRVILLERAPYAGAYSRSIELRKFLDVRGAGIRREILAEFEERSEFFEACLEEFLRETVGSWTGYPPIIEAAFRPERRVSTRTDTSI